MKKGIFKILAATMAIMMTATLFAACKTEPKEKSDKIKIGIIQYVSHASLDNCYKGLEKGLKDSDLGDKIEIDFQNGNGDTSTCDSIAKKMVAEKYDMIIGIATPAVVSAYSAAGNADIPVVFCSVSDPVASGIVESLEAPGGNCTGTSDILDFESQIKLIKAFQPNAKKIGVLYTTSEANSVSQLKELTKAAEAAGLEVVSQGVQQAADVPQAAATLAPKVDCINNMTDNNVVNNLNVVLEKANDANIPVYGSEIEQVKLGCVVSYSIDYVALGEATGKMAVKVLNGEKPATIAVEKFSKGTPVANTDVLAKFKMSVPSEYTGIETVTTTVD